MAKANREFKGVWIPRDIWLAEDLNITERVFIAEIDSLSSQKLGCFASNKHFAKWSGLTSSRCSQIISKLEDKGFISVKLVYKAGTKMVDKRFITVNDLGTKNTKEVLSKLKGGTEETKRGYLGSCEGTNTSTTNTSKSIKDIVRNEDLFNEFWELYPNKKAKKPAKTKYLNDITKAKHKKIMKHLSVMVKQRDWTKQKGKYVPLPSTYLNQERYNDPLEDNSNHESVNSIDQTKYEI